MHTVPNSTESAACMAFGHYRDTIYTAHCTIFGIMFDANFGTVGQNRANTTLRAKVGIMCSMPLFPFMPIMA